MCSGECVIWRSTSGEATLWSVTDAEAQRWQTGLRYPVSPYEAMSAKCWRVFAFSAAVNASHAWGTTAGWLQRGDGDPHKRWSMWFNSVTRKNTYQVLTSLSHSRDRALPSGTK